MLINSFFLGLRFTKRAADGLDFYFLSWRPIGCFFYPRQNYEKKIILPKKYDNSQYFSVQNCEFVILRLQNSTFWPVRLIIQKNLRTFALQNY
jgi:hypothetical protein